jgi:transposase-like protein
LKSVGTPPRLMITDKLRSYGTARAKMGFHVEHRHTKLSTIGPRILISRRGDASGS